MKKLLMLLLAVTVLVPSLWADQGIKGKNIELGSFLPLSGPVGFIGQGVRLGMETYAKWFNAEIKTGGKNLKLSFEDDQFKAEKSVQAVKNLVNNQKVFAIVGAVGTPGIVASLDFIVKTGIPFVYQGTGVSVLYDPPKRNVFPVQPSYVFEGRLFVKFIAEELKKQKIAVVFQNDAGVSDASAGAIQGMKQVLRSYRRQGVRIIGEIPMSRTDASYSPVANRIKQLDPDAVVVFAFGGAAIAVIKAAHEAGIDVKKTPFLTTYVNSDPIMFALAGRYWNDVYVGAWAKPTGGDYFKNFMRVWKQYSGSKRDPSPYNIAGWIAMETFKEGLERAVNRFGNISWNNYIKAMETFHEGGGWSDGMAYKLSYKPYKANDPTTRYPQAYMYFIYGENKEYKLYKKTKSLEELFMSAY
jgi:branched-chain amino acid transport system substrate-binding protein